MTGVTDDMEDRLREYLGACFYSMLYDGAAAAAIDYLVAIKALDAGDMAAARAALIRVEGLT